MSGTVVRLNGTAPPLENGAEPRIIALLEEVLECAMRGEVIALSLVTVAPNGVIKTHAESCGHRHWLVAGCEYLKHDLMEG